jgi:hypothetical protein
VLKSKFLDSCYLQIPTGTSEINGYGWLTLKLTGIIFSQAAGTVAALGPELVVVIQ